MIESDNAPLPGPGSEGFQTPQPPAQPENFLDSVKALGALVKASGDEQTRVRFNALLIELSNTQHIKELLRGALALCIRHKYAPMRITQQELNTLPKGWDIEVNPVSPDEYTMRLVAPNDLNRIIIPSGL